MTISTKIITFALFVGGLSAITTIASTNATFDIAARLGYQTSEQKLNNTKVSEWDAPLVGVEGNAGFTPSLIPKLRLEGRGALDILFDSGKLYADYSDTSTDYTATQLRLKAECDAGLVLGNSNLNLMPFAGVGYRTWSWDDPDPDFPHVSSWSAVYGLVGIRGDVKIRNAKLYGKVALQIPFKETISAEEFEENLDYNSTSMVEAELGLVAGKLLLGLWGEWFTYSSDRTSSINYDSNNSSSLNITSVSEDFTMTTLGVKIGFAF
jgi:hypothetical protein